ncbi:hypothetical protein SSS_02632 [Sarcoptes scabiei]|nr:hypothetical protein SSS_02632 [Sarcoptes scabiei]
MSQNFQSFLNQAPSYETMLRSDRMRNYCFESKNCLENRSFVGLHSQNESIHSGHFMVSKIDENDDATCEEKFIDPILPNELVQMTMTRTYRFKRSNHQLSIEETLWKLFRCMTLAYNNAKLTSPKWKPFKGMRMNIKEKIRLNNVIWRAWHFQYIAGRRTAVCQFSTIDNERHKKIEAILLEGKYWKRRSDVIKAEYNKWRNYYQHSLRINKKTIRLNEPCEWDSNLPRWSNNLGFETLFSTLDDHSNIFEANLDARNHDYQNICPSHPNYDQHYYDYANSREIARSGMGADFMQPGLEQLQPSIDFIENFEPIQDFLNFKESLVDYNDHGRSTLEHDFLAQPVTQNSDFCRNESTLSINLSKFRSDNYPNQSQIYSSTSPKFENLLDQMIPLRDIDSNSDHSISMNPLDYSIQSAPIQSSTITSQSNVINPHYMELHNNDPVKEMKKFSNVEYLSIGDNKVSEVIYRNMKSISSNEISPTIEERKKCLKHFDEKKSYQNLFSINSSGTSSNITSSNDNFTNFTIENNLASDFIRNKFKIKNKSVNDERSSLKKEHKLSNQKYYSQSRSDSRCFRSSNECKHLDNSNSSSRLNRMKSKQSNKCGNDDQSIHIEKRRVCHINAEQKRRGNIKNGFETVKSLLPESDFDSTTKISKALMLQKAADYIQKLEREKCDQQKEFEKLRREIDELNEKITLLQNTLPINGCSMDQKDYQSQTQTLTNLRKRYADYVSEKINENWKFHLFSIIMESVSNKYIETVSIKNFEDFYRTLFQWLEHSCSLVALRKGL